MARTVDLNARKETNVEQTIIHWKVGWECPRTDSGWVRGMTLDSDMRVFAKAVVHPQRTKTRA